jgi:hypothetical protein
MYVDGVHSTREGPSTTDCRFAWYGIWEALLVPRNLDSNFEKRSGGCWIYSFLKQRFQLTWSLGCFSRRSEIQAGELDKFLVGGLFFGPKRSKPSAFLTPANPEHTENTKVMYIHGTDPSDDHPVCRGLTREYVGHVHLRVAQLHPECRSEAAGSFITRCRWDQDGVAVATGTKGDGPIVPYQGPGTRSSTLAWGESGTEWVALVEAVNAWIIHCRGEVPGYGGGLWAEG